MSQKNNKVTPNDEVYQLAAKIKLLILDVDGVLTDGKLYFLDTGEYKAFNAKDGLGLALLIQEQIEVAIISGNQSESVQKRLKKFGLQQVYQGVKDKSVVFKQILTTLNLSEDQVAYVGDDLIDLPVMTQVALPIAVKDADEFVKQQAKWVSNYKGGQGAVREICELILSAQNKLQSIRESYLR